MDEGENYKLFKLVQDLQEISSEDGNVCHGGPYIDRLAIFNILADIFVRYTALANELAVLADDLLNPITTPMVRKLYELTVSRILQLHLELSELTGENSFNIDQHLIKNNLTPFDLRLQIPKYLLPNEDSNKDYVFMAIDSEDTEDDVRDIDVLIASRRTSTVTGTGSEFLEGSRMNARKSTQAPLTGGSESISRTRLRVDKDAQMEEDAMHEFNKEPPFNKENSPEVNIFRVFYNAPNCDYDERDSKKKNDELIKRKIEDEDFENVKRDSYRQNGEPARRITGENDSTPLVETTGENQEEAATLDSSQDLDETEAALEGGEIIETGEPEIDKGNREVNNMSEDAQQIRNSTKKLSNDESALPEKQTDHSGEDEKITELLSLTSDKEVEGQVLKPVAEELVDESPISEKKTEQFEEQREQVQENTESVRSSEEEEELSAPTEGQNGRVSENQTTLSGPNQAQGEEYCEAPGQLNDTGSNDENGEVTKNNSGRAAEKIQQSSVTDDNAKGHLMVDSKERRKSEESVKSLTEVMKTETNSIDVETVEEAAQTTEQTLKKNVIDDVDNTQAQNQAIQRFQIDKETEKQKILQNYRLHLEENLTDEIRAWMHNFHEETDSFPPEYPPETPTYITGQTHGAPKKLPEPEKIFGSADKFTPNSQYHKDFAEILQLKGSALTTSDYWITTEQWTQCQEMLNNKKSKTKSKPRKPAKDKEIKNGKGFSYTLKPTEFFNTLTTLLNNKLHEINDKVEDRVQVDAFMEAGFAVREEVDEQMRQELGLLQAAWCKDKKKRGKKKGKKGKKGKQRGKKGKKDELGEITIEECLEELLNMGLLTQNKNIRLDNYLADFGYDGKSGTSNGELKNFLTLRFILPLLSPTITEMSPKIRSLCLLGPPNSAKTFLAQCIAKETNATLITLKPEATAKLTPKEIQRLISILLKVVREDPPTVIFIENAEKLFYKKVPKSERALNPKLLGRILQKLQKKLQSTDRVLIIGTSSEPWTAKQRKLFKTFSAFLNIPTKHYGSHRLMCQSLLPAFQNESQPPAIAKITSAFNYTYDSIEKCVTFGKDKLNQTSIGRIVERLAESVPDSKDLENKLTKFREKLPLAVKSKKMENGE